MTVELEGGCRVVGLKEGEPRREGGLRIWDHFRGEKVSLRVLEGHGTVRNDDLEEVLYALVTNIGIHLPVGSEYEVSGTYLSVRTHGTIRGEVKSVCMIDAPVQRTGDRWYRELIQGETTQFVGSIPPGRAPDHFHIYEEVICILQGSGTMWAGASSTPIATGSCIYLPPKQIHCLENTGSGELRLLGVFYPAGSPAVRYPG
ncbi:MAG TPA: cupin domain-containing protein [Thermoanaerobaculia bacterium]|nr:cupin domain-containing protein [Thermoanaerobaculia bacterium]